MSNYNIDQFSQITGINKILIRTWENRYGFIKPLRTSTNIRYYNDDMLTKGIKYSLLVQNGLKISKIINLNDIELNELISELLSKTEKKEIKNDIYISKFIESAIYYNQNLFEETFQDCINQIGLINLYKTVLVKTMKKISLLYLNSEINPGNEHFFSENIRLKLSNEIEKNKNTNSNNKKWLLFLPENEYHDIGLLFSHLLLKYNKQNVIYLGQNTPRGSLLNFKKEKLNILLFIQTKQKNIFINDLIIFLHKNFKDNKLYIISKEKLDLEAFENINQLLNIDEFTSILNS
tara:strand:+ start:20371 stop:21246 length:876 start_codon:yes stop_codon:yes gene_type:complete